MWCAPMRKRFTEIRARAAPSCGRRQESKIPQQGSGTTPVRDCSSNRQTEEGTMATAAQVLPAPRRRSRQTLASGRAPVREVYFVKRIDNSRLVRQVDHSRHRKFYALAGLVGLAFLLCFAYAGQHFQCVRYGYQIEQMRQRQISLEKWNRELKAEEQRL